jgi:hypothetical protein
VITILAIDPGAKQKAGTLDKRGTGVAVLEVHDDKPPVLRGTLLAPGGTQTLIDWLTGPLYVPMRSWWDIADEVVVENFLHLNAQANIEPLEMVGVIRGLGAAQGKPVVVQNPADRTIVSHDDLKRVGMWPGSAGHADEAQAVRHALARALRSGNRPTVELLAPDDEATPDDPGPSSW